MPTRVFTSSPEASWSLSAHEDTTPPAAQKSELERRLIFLEAQREALECIARDESLSKILQIIAEMIEAQSPDMLCSILILEGDVVRHGAAPSLPQSYTMLVDGAQIGEGRGSCGTAAYRGQRVIAEDLATDPNWIDYRELALGHGLHACWSSPIISSTGKVLGTFGSYYRTCKHPSEADLRLVDEATSLAGIAIERERRRRELMESEERFRLVAHVTNNALWFADLEADKLYWSEGFASVFGHAQSDLAVSPSVWMGFVHPEDRDRVVGSIQAALLSASNRWSAEYRFQRGDGSYATVLDRGHLIHNAKGVPVRMIGGMMDLSGHLDAEDQLAEQATLLDEATDAIIVRDLQHRVVYWNSGAEKIYGWTRDEARTLCVEEFQADHAKFLEATRAVVSQGSWSGELEQHGKEGKVRQMQCRWTLLRDRRGQPKSILAINTDITEKKQLESQFLRAQRMESIGTLAGGIAHDLNNVLTPIMMGMDLLRMHTCEPAALNIIDMVEDTAKRGAEMIGQVLSFARGLDGQRHFIKLPQIAREVSRILKDTLPRNIRLNLVGDQTVPSILGDATQIHQVLVNLCVNARDAMPQGGEITIAIDQAPAWPKAHPDNLPGPCVQLTVSDNGSGIPLAVQERIFEPFFTTKEVGKGTGLGLATVQAIVRSHSGLLELVSEEGKGTSFIMWFPAAEPAVASPVERKPAEAKPPSGNGETILVVDDEESLRRMTAQTLEAFGYRTLTATDGADAIRIYTQHQNEIAVVLTDMMMPVMDGPAAVQALLAMNPRIKIIAATGLAQDDKLCIMQSLGVTHFLPKPFPTATMLKLVHALIHSPC